MSKVLELRNICMKFKSGDGFIDVLKDINFLLHSGESVALLGQSGSGKTTFIQIAALLEKPTSGEVIINGEYTANISDEQKTKLRRQNIGFVYQFHNLLAEFSALENVIIPQLICGKSKKQAVEKATFLLGQVGLIHRLNQSPKKLSGGEQQRVAIARALANDPKIVIADEPTGNLDPQNAEIVFDLLLKLVSHNDTALLMATHNIELSKKLSSTIRLVDGRL